MALGDIQMADATGPRLLAKRVDVKPAHADQLPVRKSPQQLFSRRVKTVFPVLPVLRQATQHVQVLRQAFGAQRRKTGFVRGDGGNQQGCHNFLRQVSL